MLRNLFTIASLAVQMAAVAGYGGLVDVISELGSHLCTFGSRGLDQYAWAAARCLKVVMQLPRSHRALLCKVMYLFVAAVLNSFNVVSDNVILTKMVKKVTAVRRIFKHRLLLEFHCSRTCLAFCNFIMLSTLHSFKYILCFSWCALVAIVRFPSSQDVLTFT